MHYAKGIIVLGVLALAMGEHVASEEQLWKTCMEMEKVVKEAMAGSSGEALDPVKFLSIVKQWNDGKLPSTAIEAFETILNNGECSDQSIDYFYRIDTCIRLKKLFSGPSRVYANKCLTPEFVSRMVKSSIDDSGDKMVALIDQDFMNMFWRENPSFKLGLRTDWKFGVMAYSGNIAIKVIYKKFPEIGNKADTYNREKKVPNLKTYLEEKLFTPCKKYAKANMVFMYKLSVASESYDGKSEKLIAGLDQDARDKIFRYLYCSTPEYVRDSLFGPTYGREERYKPRQKEDYHTTTEEPKGSSGVGLLTLFFLG